MIPQQQRLSPILKPIWRLSCILVCCISLVYMREHALCDVSPNSRTCQYMLLNAFSFSVPIEYGPHHQYTQGMAWATLLPRISNGSFFFQFFCRRRQRHTTYGSLYLETCPHGPLYSYVPRMYIHLLHKQPTWLSLKSFYISYPVLYLYWDRTRGSCTICDAEQLGWTNGRC